MKKTTFSECCNSTIRFGNTCSNCGHQTKAKAKAISFEQTNVFEYLSNLFKPEPINSQLA